MSISKEQINNIFHSSKISYNDHEREKIKTKILNVLTLIDQVKNAKLDEIKPLYSITEKNHCIREDLSNNKSNTDTIFQNLPIQEKEFAEKTQYYRIQNKKNDNAK